MGRVFKQTHPPSDNGATTQPSDFSGLSSVSGRFVDSSPSVDQKKEQVFFLHVGVRIKKVSQTTKTHEEKPFQPWVTEVKGLLARHFPGISRGNPISVPQLIQESKKQNLGFTGDPLMPRVVEATACPPTVKLTVISGTVRDIVYHRSTGKVGDPPESLTVTTRNGSVYQVTLLMQ